MLLRGSRGSASRALLRRLLPAGQHAHAPPRAPAPLQDDTATTSASYDSPQRIGARWFGAARPYARSKKTAEVLAECDDGPPPDGASEYGEVRSFDVEPGCSLSVKLPSGVADFRGVPGSLESITVKTSWRPSMGPDAPFLIAGAPNGARVEDLSSSPPPEGCPYPGITAWLPERFCSLQLLTSGGDVYLKQLKEGTLSVYTAGGDVVLGSIYGAIADIETGGGVVRANVLSATLTVRTAGGRAELGRVVSDRATISLSGGEGLVDAMYAGEADVETGGGRFHAKAVSASERANIHSAGGDVRVDGADGLLHIDSAGGNIEVVALEGTRELVATSSGGNIHCHVAKGLNVRIVAFASGGVEVVEGTTKLDGKVTHDEVDAYHLSMGAGGGGAHGSPGRGAPHPSDMGLATIRLDAGAGKVILQGRGGWIDGMAGLEGLRR